MIKFLSAISACLLVSASAFADRQELVLLSCVGTNGLVLEFEAGSKLVSTKLGLFSKTFETNGTVFISDDAKMTRIALGLVGAPHAYVYDIYLANAPVRKHQQTLNGVIGHSVYGLVVAPGGGPVPFPLGFVPSTDLTCDILTK